MIKTLCSVTAFVAILAIGAPVNAQQTLALDFQPTGGTTAAGFLAFEETNQVLPGAGTTYPGIFTPTGPTVSLTVANLPDGNLDFRAVARNGAATDTVNDWLGVDTRNTGTDVTMTIDVAGLPAGIYTWLSEHHDGGAGATNGNLNGAADFTFTDALGTSTGLQPFSAQNNGDPISTFSTSFTSDGVNSVSLSLAMDLGQGLDPNDIDTANHLFAFANSLVITQIPEPSTYVLLGAGLAVAALVRRRK